MNRKTLIAALAVIITIAACVKEKQNIIPPNNNSDTTNTDTNQNDTTVINPNDTTNVDTPVAGYKGITITGAEDKTVEAYGKAEMYLKIRCDSCEGKEIFLTVEGLENKPEMEAVLTNDIVYTGWGTTLILRSYFSKPATTEIRIIASDRNGREVTAYPKITVPFPSGDCTEYIHKATGGEFEELRHLKAEFATVDTVINNYYGIPRLVSSGNNSYYLQDVPLAWNATANTFYRSLLPASPYHLLFRYNCYNNTIEIPEQIVQGRTNGGATEYFRVNGTGTIDNDTRTCNIEYTTYYKVANKNIVNTFKLIATIDNL